MVLTPWQRDQLLKDAQDEFERNNRGSGSWFIRLLHWIFRI